MENITTDNPTLDPQCTTSQQNVSENKTEFKTDPVYATCPQCGESAMTLVQTDNSCCSCERVLMCVFSALCGVCSILFSGSGGSVPTHSSEVFNSSTTKVTYSHKCSSCQTEIGTFTSSY